MNGLSHRWVMKVSESGKRKWRSGHASGLCDFCGVREARHSINGSLWFICTVCMTKVEVDIPRAIKECLEEEE